MESSTENFLDIPEETLNELHQILLNTQEQCQMMDQLIHNQINVKDEMINKLHKELEYYKQDQAERYVEQLMKALIKIRKHMGKKLTSPSWESLSGENLRQEYLYAFEDMTDMLQQQDIDPYESEAGAAFDASKHQIFKIEATEDQSLDRTIKESVSEGYKKGNKIIIAERVIVYQMSQNGGRK